MAPSNSPVSMLDVSVRADILNGLLDLRDRDGMAIVFITHDIAVARYVADRVAVMYLGAFAEVEPADEIIDDPQHPYTRALLSHTLPAGDEDVHGDPIEIRGDPPTPIDLKPGCQFAGRCPYAFPRCHMETPKLLPQGQGRAVACHLFDGNEQPVR
jgi:peptide/nickel transport system ATP-binding protein